MELGKRNGVVAEQQAVAIDVEQEGMVAYRDSVTAEETGDVVYNKLVVNRGGRVPDRVGRRVRGGVNSESELVYPVRFCGEEESECG